MICDWDQLNTWDQWHYCLAVLGIEYPTLLDTELAYRSERGSVGASAEIERRAALESD
jgi:hypothetical protein